MCIVGFYIYIVYMRLDYVLSLAVFKIAAFIMNSKWKILGKYFCATTTLSSYKENFNSSWSLFL